MSSSEVKVHPETEAEFRADTQAFLAKACSVVRTDCFLMVVVNNDLCHDLFNAA